MGGQGKWKARGERNREKTWSGRSQNTSYTHPFVPTPSSYPRHFQSRPVPSGIGEGAIRHIFAILRNLVSRIDYLDRCVHGVPVVERCRHRRLTSDLNRTGVNTVPQTKRLHECESCRRSSHFTSCCPRQQEVKKSFITIGIQTESPYLSHAIDITRCRYCSNWDDS